MLKEYVDNLVSLGLSEKESKVYLTLLNEGTATADQLSKLSKLNRSTVYLQLTILMQHGLASTFKRGKKTLFAAESPNNLERLLEQKVRELETKKAEAHALVPNLLKVYTGTGIRPVVRTFEGKAGLITMRNEVLTSGCKELFAAFSFDDLYSIFTVPELMSFSNARAKKSIKSYVLYNKEGGDAVEVPPQELRRLEKEIFPFESDIYIYGDSVSLATTSGDIIGVTVIHPQIANGMRSLFKLAWDSAPKHKA